MTTKAKPATGLIERVGHPSIPLRDELAVRWHMNMTRAARYADDYRICCNNSKRFDRINDTLEEMAVRMVDETMDDEEYWSLTPLTEGIWQVIEERITAWAIGIEEARAERQKERAS